MSTPTVPPPADGDARGDAVDLHGGTEGDRLIDLFTADRVRRAQLEAQEIRTLARLQATHVDEHARGPRRAYNRDIARRSLIAELATAARVSEWTVSRLLAEAADLCERFAPAVTELESGAISRQHVTAIHEAGAAIIDDAAREAYLSLAIPRARELSPGRLGPVVRALAERFLDRSLEDRRTAANERRCVDVIDLPDGMASLTTTLDAVLAHAIDDRLTQQARAVIDARPSVDAEAESDAAPGVYADECASDAADDDAADTRTLAQVRADILTDLLLTAGPSDCIGGDALASIRGTVQVTVPVLTMVGDSDEPCLMAGYGPIDAETARALAGNAPGWERVMTHPVCGQVLQVDRYRPGIALQRFLVARDERCRFPGCRRPVWRCDIDHTIAHEDGGPTAAHNLGHLCRRHHTLKHASNWSVEQVDAGVLVWTSPSGRRHTERPEPVVRFVPDHEVLSRRRCLREPWLFSDDDPDDTRAAAPF